jgi:amino acid adenylation domain-containing protein
MTLKSSANRLDDLSSQGELSFLLADRFDAVAHLRADAIAIVDGQRQMSYRELLLRADVLARELEARGIGPRDLVGIVLPRSAELVVAVVGIARAGAAYVPIDVNQPAPRRAFILSDANPKLIVTDGALVEGIPPRIEILQLPEQLHARPEPMERRRRPSIEDPAYVIYTSGSTGQPKGVVVTQRNAARLFTITEPLFKFGATDVWTLFHSIGFDVSVWELWGALLHGGRLVVVPALTARAADAFHALVIGEEVTVLNQTPSAFRVFDAADAAAGRPANQLRYVVLAGESLDPRCLKPWFESHGDERPHSVNMYGITETTVHVTYRRMLGKDADGSGKSLIGTPLADLRIDLLGPDDRPVAVGEVGEIFVGGAGVTAGYLGRSKLTAERFLPDPHAAHPNARLYRSGDLARRLPDGDLEYLGRADDQVKLRGFRIELGEIEAVLCKAANVRDAVVALRNHSNRGPQLIAYVVQDNRRPLDGLSLREHVAHYLPEYMVPAAFVLIQNIPRTINDKIDRAALPPPSAADYESAGTPPRDNCERAVAAIISEVLDSTITARESDFFRLGGDSLKAMRVVMLCQERLHVDLSVNLFFDNPTIAALASLVRHESSLGRDAKPIAHVARGDPITLSPQQYALWLDLKIRGDGNTYNEALAFRVTSSLEPARLLRALVHLAQAHEVLRARLIEVDGEPRLVFDRAASAVEFESLEANVADEAERNLIDAAHRPFNLSEGPLWRAVLYNKPDGGSVLMLVVHHLILDAAAERILLDELIASYSDPDAPHAARAYDFVDLAAHECARLATEGEALERFWANDLAGAKLTIDLPPPCVPCPPEAEDIACVSRRAIGSALARRVRDLAASWGLTPFHLYLSAYLILLRTYAASDDLVVGSPVSLRDIPAADGVVGYLLNPVAFRAHLAGDHSFRAIVEDVALRWQQVRAHARLPMHLVLHAAAGGQRTGLGSPVQTFFSLVRDPSESLLIDGSTLDQIYIPPVTAKFNLFLLVQEQQEDASLVLQFRRGTFDPEMADRFLRHFEMLLLAATESPESLVAKLPIADQGELIQLREWGTHASRYPRDRTVADIFQEVARQQEGTIALVAGESQISYAAVDSRANAVAAKLRRAGVSKGDRVPLLLPRGVRFIACALGVMKCGAAYVPLDPSYPPERLRRMLEGLGARVGIGRAESSIDSGTVNWLDASLADELSSIPAPPCQVGPEDPAYVMFTSGSTGQPKGVEVPHRAIVRLIFAQDFARMGPAETWLHMAPVSFDASTLEIWAPLLHGGRCVILEEEIPTPKLIDEVIRRQSVTSAWITSSLFNVIVDEAPSCLSGLTQIFIGGEALSPSHVRRALDYLPGVRLVNGYGPTENTTFTCFHLIRREDVDSGCSIPIGRPIANTTVHVVDPDGRLAPVGVPGELLAGGDGVALGYIGQPEMTEQSFLPDTFSRQPGARLYRSGDRVRWRPDGVLEFFGRFDNQVKIRGHRVEPDEVAVCLAEHHSVRQAVVVLQQTAVPATQLVACVVPRNEDYSGPALRRLLTHHVSERLPLYMVPAKFIFLPELPLTPNGKLDLAALQDTKRDSIPTWAEAPLSSVDLRILKILQDVLQQGDLGPDDDFMEAGGDSLLAVTVLLRLESEFGNSPAARVMAGGFSARQLAAFLQSPSRLHATYPPGFVEIRAGSADRPLFCLPGMSGTALQFGTLATKLRTPRPIVAIELHNLPVGSTVFKSIEGTARAIIGLMREVQPSGPYAILGYSFGGNLAVELARQLIADNQTVELVAILDSHAPGSLRSPTGVGKLATHLRIIKRQKLRETYTYIQSRIYRRLFRRSQESLVTDLAPASPQTGIERRIAEVAKHCVGALDAYYPKVFPGRIVLLRATDLDDWLEVADPSGTCGWGSICRGGVDVISMTCRHLDVLRMPHLTTLAAHINNLLDAIDS